MSKKFNLLLLSSSLDIHPRTWICLKGTCLNRIFRDIEQTVLIKQKWSREKLSREMASQLNCSPSTIKRVLQRKSGYYPIPIILKLLRFTPNRKNFFSVIKQNITYLKVNSASAKPIKAVSKLGEGLAKIVGAFMADGHLSVQLVFASPTVKNLEKITKRFSKLKIRYSAGKAPSRNQYYISVQVNRDNFDALTCAIPSFHCRIQTHYNFGLTEEYKDNVEAFIGWLKEAFGIEPCYFAKRPQNAWRVDFSNKILARYLMTFFGVIPGPKTYIAFEPQIIRRSRLNIRRSFARGVLMFDGAVTKQGKMMLDVASKSLRDSIADIWNSDGIQFGLRTSLRKTCYQPTKKQAYIIYTTEANTQKSKFLRYFEKDTQKWKLLKWLAGDLQYVPLLKTASPVTVLKMFALLQKIGRCDSKFLEKYFGCSHLTVRSHLKILKKQGKIILTTSPSCINGYVDENATVLLKKRFHYYLFSESLKKFKTDKNFSTFLSVHKATMSAWKKRKNRIPIITLKEMCKILDVEFIKAAKNIAQVDREIAEII